MKTSHTSLLLSMLLAAAIRVGAAENSTLPEGMPPMPEPTQEHSWLQKFVGEWESTAELTMAPDQPPVSCSGRETVRAIGEFWVVAEGHGQMPGMPVPMTSVMTLGYDREKQQFVGSWISSMDGTLWLYEGALDASGKKLTLESEGPSPMDPTTTTKFRDVTEFVSEDERVFTSSMQNPDGSWTTFVKGTFRRKQ